MSLASVSNACWRMDGVMSNPIGWCSTTWNPVTGCTKVSEGCLHCYAERMARRLNGRYGYPSFVSGDPFGVTLHPMRLDEPLHWREERLVFVCSMGDLFHEDVPDDFLVSVFGAMFLAPQHTYQVLTKRPERMRDFLLNAARWRNKPPKNIWLGVTTENQEQARKRIPILLDTPAAVRFVSVEPCLGPVDLVGAIQAGLGRRAPLDCLGFIDGLGYGLDWVIVGGETGPGARPMHPDWVRALRDQCIEGGVPFWFKGWGTLPGRTHMPAAPRLDGVEWHQRPREEER